MECCLLIVQVKGDAMVTRSSDCCVGISSLRVCEYKFSSVDLHAANALVDILAASPIEC